MTTEWKAYKQHGSYFRLYNDILEFSPMLENGERDTEDGEVDWLEIENIEEMKQVQEELERQWVNENIPF